LKTKNGEENVKRWVSITFIVVLVLALLASLVLYFVESGSLKKANATIASDEAYIKAVRYPSHFKTLDDLNKWLLEDDVNTKYATIPAVDRAYVLEIRAAQDGYMLPAFFEQDKTDSTKLYFLNMANIAGKLYVVNSANDSVTLRITLVDAPSFRPLVPATTTAK
jgi:hypothetical protein